MAFKPPKSNVSSESSFNWNAINKQVRGGSRPARISLIVDLGIQHRDNFTEPYVKGSTKHEEALTNKGAFLTEDDKGKTIINVPRTDVPQVAVFADLTSDVVDYEGDIGKQPYRILLNNSYRGDVKGIDFNGSYSYDEKGNILKDKGFTFHAQSPLHKLSKVTHQNQIISGSGDDNMDVEQLLAQPFMAQITKVEDGDKCYINYKGCAEVPMIPSDPSDPDSDEVMMTVKPLVCKPMLITFTDVTEESIKFVRGDIAKKIKQAVNYEGSAMQKFLEAKSSQQKPKETSVTAGDKPEKQESFSSNFDNDFDEEAGF